MNRESALTLLRSIYAQAKTYSRGSEVCFGQPFYDICEEFGIDIKEVTGEEN